MEESSDQKIRQKTIKKRIILEGSYTIALAQDFSLMSKHLGLPEKILRRWRKTEDNGIQEGWLSYPISVQEYRALLIIVNYLWGREELIRMQMANKPMSKRLKLARCSDKTWIERVVLEDLIRRKLLGKRQYLTWEYYRGEMRARYPRGYVQLTWEILQRMNQAARDAIRQHKKAGTLDLLVKSVGLKTVAGKIMSAPPRVSVKTPKQKIMPGYETNIPEEYDY